MEVGSCIKEEGERSGLSRGCERRGWMALVRRFVRGSEGGRRVMVDVDADERWPGGPLEEGREYWPARLERRLLDFECVVKAVGVGEPRPSAAVAKEAAVLTLSVDWLRLWWILRSMSRRVSGVSGVGGGCMSSRAGPISIVVAVGPLAVDTEATESASES
jgi:hypothetical protein